MNLFLRSVNVQRSFIHSIPASKKERNITTDFFLIEETKTHSTLTRKKLEQFVEFAQN